MCTAQVGLKWLSCTPGSHSVCAVRTLSGVDQKILSLRRKPILRALVAQARCPGFDSPFHFPLSSLLNIYNSSLFQHEARVLSIKTWEGRMCFQDKFRLTCMASQAFKACLQYTKNSCFMLEFRCYEAKIELSPVCCHQYANTEGVREPERFNDRR